jgi:Tfp pilus assembly protein PilN
VSRDRYLDPNLARAPFENARPVRRLALALWILAFLATATALWIATTARREVGTRQQALTRATAEAAAARESATRLRARLETENLAERNARTEFLNARIAERAFSWTELFDALGEVLPRGVRVQNLAPQGFSSRQGQGGNATSHIGLKISGEAETGEALLDFVDRLYVHRAFRDPNLSREATRKDARLDFTLAVAYRPGWLEGGSPLTAESGAPAATTSPTAAAAAGAERSRPGAAPTASADSPRAVALPPAAIGAPPSPPGRPATARPTRPTRPPFQRESSFERAEPEVELEEPATDPSAPRRERTGAAGSAAGGAVMLPAPLRPYASPPEGFR